MAVENIIIGKTYILDKERFIKECGDGDSLGIGKDFNVLLNPKGFTFERFFYISDRESYLKSIKKTQRFCFYCKGMEDFNIAASFRFNEKVWRGNISLFDCITLFEEYEQEEMEL